MGAVHYWRVYVTAGTIAVQSSSVPELGTAPAFAVHSENLDLNQLTGNSATGGVPAFLVSGSVSTSSTWHSEGASWLLGPAGCGVGLTIPSGVTVTVEAGAVIKGANESYIGCGGAGAQLSVEGTLNAVGTGPRTPGHLHLGHRQQRGGRDGLRQAGSW